MARPKDNAVEPASRSETISSPRVRVLAPWERRAPIAYLSPSKRSALEACFDAGELYKKDGAWHGAPGGKPISGITTADLARDGMLTVTTKHRNGSARLTERGNWFVRTLLCDGTAAKLAAPPKRLAPQRCGDRTTDQETERANTSPSRHVQPAFPAQKRLRWH
jgi:hypothetical protein